MASDESWGELAAENECLRADLDGLATENARLTERLGAALADKAKLSAENFQLRLQVREETAAANRAWSAAMEFNDARRAE